jgi:hypothetical protein
MANREHAPDLGHLRVGVVEDEPVAVERVVVAALPKAHQIAGVLDEGASDTTHSGVALPCAIEGGA